MKRFYKESGMLVCEFEEFERSLLLGTYGFKLSAEQWKNRRTGRTKVKPEERIAMQHILDMIRKKTCHQTEVQTIKFHNNASTL